MRSKVHAFGCLLTAAFLICAAKVAFAQFSISRFTIDGGGGTRSTGGGFGVGGTIGQPDAGSLFASPFVLSGGFWGAGGGIVTAIEGDPIGDDLQTETPL